MVWAAAIPAAINVGSALFSSIMNRNRGNKPSGLDKRKKRLVDELLSSLQGEGQYGDLFNASDETFQKSYVEPAMAQFRNQTAPNIQQSYIASGQQRGTGLEDSLSRAGVNMDQMLNEQYYTFQQDALNRKQNAINQILGTQYGQGQPGQSVGSAATQGFGGYLSQQKNPGQGVYDFFNQLLKSDQQIGRSPLLGAQQAVRTGYAG